MSYSPHPTVVPGDTWTASNQMTYVAGNFTAVWAGTTAGDMDYYASSTGKTRIPIGAAGQALGVVGGVPAWMDVGVGKRQGASPTDWSSPGATNYTPAASKMQAGSVQLALTTVDKSSVAVTFPVAFSDKPLVFVSITPQSAIEVDFNGDGTFGVGVRLYLSGLSASGVTINLGLYHFNANSRTFTINWFAVGPP